MTHPARLISRYEVRQLVACPVCGAEAGSYCTDVGRTVIRANEANHLQRVYAALDARGIDFSGDSEPAQERRSAPS